MSATLADYRHLRSLNLLDKCRRFAERYREHQRRFGAGGQHRLTLTSGLDRAIRIEQGDRERELICFDSSSYLHLHRHPRVIAAPPR